MTLPARKLTDDERPTEQAPKLQLVTDEAAPAAGEALLDEPETEADEAEKAEVQAERSTPEVDLLRTYVRQIGNGQLLTAARSASSRGARTPATSGPSAA